MYQWHITEAPSGHGLRSQPVLPMERKKRHTDPDKITCQLRRIAVLRNIWGTKSEQGPDSRLRNNLATEGVRGLYETPMPWSVCPQQLRLEAKAGKVADSAHSNRHSEHPVPSPCSPRYSRCNQGAHLQPHVWPEKPSPVQLSVLTIPSETGFAKPPFLTDVLQTTLCGDFPNITLFQTPNVASESNLKEKKKIVVQPNL